MNMGGQQQFGQPYFLGVPVPHDPPSTAVGGMQGYNASFDADRIRKATKVSTSSFARNVPEADGVRVSGRTRVH